VHVRVDESRYEKSAGPIYPPSMRTGNKVCADFGNPAIADHHVCMKQRNGAFRRDQRNIFDYRAILDHMLRGRCRSPGIGLESITSQSLDRLCCGKSSQKPNNDHCCAPRTLDCLGHSIAPSNQLRIPRMNLLKDRR
jgi:hypothetical protein